MTIDELRNEIDKIDNEMKSLFVQRMGVSKQISDIKAASGADIYNPEREKEIIEKRSSDIDESIKNEYISMVKNVIGLSRKYQYRNIMEKNGSELDIDYIEIEPKAQNAAALKSELYIIDSISKDSIHTVDDHRQLSEIVMSGKCNVGISVMETIGKNVSNGFHKLLIHNPLYINRCDIVEDGEYRKKVVTFSRDLVILPKHNRIKLMFVCENKCSGLASLLSVISDYGVEISGIHTVPFIDSVWNYVFMLELKGSLLDKNTRTCIYQMMHEADEFKILGSYTCTE